MSPGGAGADRLAPGSDRREASGAPPVAGGATPRVRTQVRAFITRQTDRDDRLVLALYYHEGLTPREIGAVLERTEAEVAARIEQLVARLKEFLDQRDAGTVF